MEIAFLCPKVMLLAGDYSMGSAVQLGYFSERTAAARFTKKMFARELQLVPSFILASGRAKASVGIRRTVRVYGEDLAILVHGFRLIAGPLV